MKKLFTLLLVLTCYVGTASAVKLYVNTSTNCSWWTNVRIYAYNSDSDNNGWDYSETGVVSSTTTLFGKNWYVFEMGDYSNAIVQYFESSNHNITNQSSNIEGITHDRFVILPGTETDGKWVWYENGYTFRSNVLDNWGSTTCNMTVVDNNTLSYTLTKSVINASGVDKIWFRILNQEGQIYPQEEGKTLDLPSSTSTYYNNWTDTGWSFGIAKPKYDYEKIVVTASLSGSTWTISADAYITVSVSDAGYATFSYACPLDFSEVTGFDAYVASGIGDDNGSKYVQMTKESGAVPAETGLLLVKEGGCTNVEVPVAASAEAPTNLLVATVTETTVDASTKGAYHYFLANGANGIGFYNLASSATSGANKAYLSTTTELTSGSTPSKVAWTFNEDESSEVDAVNHLKIPFVENNAPMYNLAGQRVNNDYKGVVVKNGKKFINK